MSKKRKLKYILLLMLGVICCLNGCTTANYNFCVSYPIAGEKVAAELEKVPYNGYENFWEWLGRIDKLRQEIELCR